MSKKRHLHAHSPDNFKELKCYDFPNFCFFYTCFHSILGLISMGKNSPDVTKFWIDKQLENICTDPLVQPISAKEISESNFSMRSMPS